MQVLLIAGFFSNTDSIPLNFYYFLFLQLLSKNFFIGPAKYLFYENALKKNQLNIFSNFFFYLKVQSFRLIMENNFVQMAGHAVTYTIDPIFNHIIDCKLLYFTNGFTNIVLLVNKRK